MAQAIETIIRQAALPAIRLQHERQRHHVPRAGRDRAGWPRNTRSEDRARPAHGDTEAIGRHAVIGDE